MTTSHTYFILAGDVGGTSTRFQLLSCTTNALGTTGTGTGTDTIPFAPVPKTLQTFSNEEHTTFENILMCYLGGVGNVIPTVVVLACAGPVGGNEVRMTASSWMVRGRDVKGVLEEMRSMKEGRER